MPSRNLSEAEKRAVGLADQASLLVEGGDAKVSDAVTLHITRG